MIEKYSKNLIDTLSYEEAMRLSAWFIRQGKCTDAVKLICDTFLYEMSQRRALKEKLQVDSSAISFSVSQHQSAWPTLGAELTFDHKNEPSIVYSKENFGSAEALTYFAYLKNAIANEDQQSALTGWSRLLYWLTVIRFAVAEQIPRLVPIIPRWISYEKRRKIVENLYSLKTTLSGELNSIADRTAIWAISKALHEPRKKATRIHKQNKVRIYLLKANEHASGRNIEQIFRNLHWDQERELTRFLNNYQKPLVIASIHMGFHIGPVKKFNWVFNDIAHHDLMVLSQREDIQEDADIHNEEVKNKSQRRYKRFTPRQINTMEIVKSIRKGNTTLFVYYDLPPAMGEAVEVNFLNQEARFTKGPAQIAITSRVPILPVFTFRDKNKRHRIVAHDIIETDLLPQEQLDAAVKRITQKLVSIAETHIREYPEQWHFISALDNYFVGDKGVAVNF